jgi:hypothetical protein
MTGVRTTRRLEQACAEQLPLLWLTGGQRPDHNTLWRFYQAHRVGMGHLFTQTVRTAVTLDLVDLAVQAVDGTKLKGSVARANLRSEAGLQLLLEGVNEVLAQVDSQHAGDGGGEPPRLPLELESAQARTEQIAAAWESVQRDRAPARRSHARTSAGQRKEHITDALEAVRQAGGPERASPTDPDARLQKLRGGGYAVGYNGQAAAAGLQPEHTQGCAGSCSRR